jgi:hypothetical protein
MTTPPAASPPPDAGIQGHGLRRRMFQIGVGSLAFYFVLAYIFMPLDWKSYISRHPTLDDVPGITLTASGIPGDPLNVALVGTAEEVMRLMLAAHWHPADPLTWRSCMAIAVDTVLGRTYDDAPVSNLYLWGRKEDFAFEQPVGDNPRKRHHVRFWRSDKPAPDGRSVWVGAATYDDCVGFSHTTGQITHHIAADVDAERDHLFRTLEATNDLSEIYMVDGFHKVREGRNGGGDRWYTDGRLEVGIVAYPLPR